MSAPYLAHHLSATAREQQDVIHRQRNSWRHAQRQSVFFMYTIRHVPEHKQLSQLAMAYTLIPTYRVHDILYMNANVRPTASEERLAAHN